MLNLKFYFKFSKYFLQIVYLGIIRHDLDEVESFLFLHHTFYPGCEGECDNVTVRVYVLKVEDPL